MAKVKYVDNHMIQCQPDDDCCGNCVHRDEDCDCDFNICDNYERGE